MAAPTPQAHVRHFLATVDDYQQMSTSYPLGDSINGFGHREDDSRRWAVVLHASLLRKYFAPRDDLHLDKVVASLRQCATEKSQYTDRDWDELQGSMGRVPNVSQYQSGNGASYGEGDLLRILLYGKYLHGEYEKWLEAERVSSFGSDGAVFFATHSRAARVVNLAEFIRGGVETGHATLDS